MARISCPSCSGLCSCYSLFITLDTLHHLFALLPANPADLDPTRYLLPHDILRREHTLHILETLPDGSKIIQVTKASTRSKITFDVVVRPLPDDWTLHKPFAWMRSVDEHGRSVYDPDGFVVRNPPPHPGQKGLYAPVFARP